MAWLWRYRDADGGTASTGESEAFPNQSDAETWLGENWQGLLSDGVTQVALEEDGRVEYEMPLTPAEE